MSEDRARYVYQFRLAARILSQSCESCERREFDFLLHDTFVCESCKEAAR